MGQMKQAYVNRLDIRVGGVCKECEKHDCICESESHSNNSYTENFYEQMYSRLCEEQYEELQKSVNIYDSEVIKLICFMKILKDKYGITKEYDIESLLKRDIIPNLQAKRYFNKHLPGYRDALKEYKKLIGK